MLAPPRYIASSSAQGDLIVRDDVQFRSAGEYEAAIVALITDLDLKITGTLNPPMENGSMSLMVSLLESGVYVHTWPDERQIQLIVHLCDFQRDNHLKTIELFRRIAASFGADPERTKWFVVRTDGFGRTAIHRPKLFPKNFVSKAPV